MKRIIFLSLFGFVLTACNTVKYNYVAETKQISYPDLNVVTKTVIGDDMVRQGTVAARDVVYFPQTTVVSGIVDFTIHAGEYPKVGEDQKYLFFGLNELNSGVTVGKSAFADIPVGIRTNKQNNDLCIITVSGSSLCKGDASFSYQKKNVTYQNAFQQILIYNGKVGNKINIGYKEFNNDFARPAFSNNVEYDLSESKVIRYKGAELEIIKATNQFIEYKVYSNFNLR
ncbi:MULTISPECIES: hypothetical protein [unclassified Gilliamella]|uniref:hypothetical protein n=1 Tax=unclassified Gilliamella TaxID=2685620 RepID=UPI000B6C7B9C|nr:MULTISPECIES: hypothetical protein [unclassified Gilliamella]OTQ75540.1 hypothetical protein B6C99_00460 [Gilliamella sp. N-G2]OTQ80654.1 hypothetical protein B6D23_00940 [Gilliamella sp. N-W3]